MIRIPPRLLLLSPLRKRRLRWSRHLRQGLLLLTRLLHDGREHRGVDEAHEHESLENGEAELWGLSEELGSPFGIGHRELFHLREDIKELTGREGREGRGDGVGKGHARWEVDALRECGERGCWRWWWLAL